MKCLQMDLLVNNWRTCIVYITSSIPGFSSVTQWPSSLLQLVRFVHFLSPHRRFPAKRSIKNEEQLGDFFANSAADIGQEHYEQRKGHSDDSGRGINLILATL
jgi:hypothetical protein